MVLQDENELVFHVKLLFVQLPFSEEPLTSANLTMEGSVLY